MRLRALYFDDVVIIPGCVDIAGGTALKREQAFHVDDGWDLRETLPGVFSIHREGMGEPVTVGGYGYSYTRFAEQRLEEVPDVLRPMKKGKRHAEEGKQQKGDQLQHRDRAEGGET